MNILHIYAVTLIIHNIRYYKICVNLNIEHLHIFKKIIFINIFF